MALKDELRRIVDDKIQRRKEQAAKDKLLPQPRGTSEGIDSYY